MTRTYSQLANSSARDLLNVLTDRTVTPEGYRQALISLGEILGEAILSEIKDPECSVYLASTVEDADFLTQGILHLLVPHLPTLGFVCFWNQRFAPFDIADLIVAPILRKYQEPSSKTINYLILVKSIISGTCVVKTNLSALIESIEPEKIFVVAPVIHTQAEQNLKKEFSETISDKFQFFYLAKDDEINAAGEVIPGIGGMVYERLGLVDQDGKNHHTPEIVESRRAKQLMVQ
jgi:hypothetical protein